MSVERIQQITGRGLPVRGHNIDTDRIIPARFLRSVSFEGLEQHLFEDDIAQAGGSHPLSNPDFVGARLLFVNANFGCGSSREHAPQAIQRRGIRGVVGESFSEIFFGNAVALGMPCVSVSPADAERLIQTAEGHPEHEFTLDLASMTVSGAAVTARVILPPGAREAFMEGTWDATGLLLSDYDQVQATARRLPYIAGWQR